jgi:hypothetical protein
LALSPVVVTFVPWCVPPWSVVRQDNEKYVQKGKVARLSFEGTICHADLGEVLRNSP